MGQEFMKEVQSRYENFIKKQETQNVYPQIPPASTPKTVTEGKGTKK